MLYDRMMVLLDYVNQVEMGRSLLPVRAADSTGPSVPVAHL